MNKNLYLLISFTLIAFRALSTPLQGNYTIDAGSGSSGSNFSSWLDFQQSIVSNGVSGMVYVDVITDDNTNTQIVFSAIAGVSASNRIIINGKGRELMASLADAVILFNGADYVTIDSMRIKNSSSSPLAIGIRFSNNSSFNTITRCLLEFSGLANTAAFSGAYIAFADAPGSLTASITSSPGTHNLIQYNVMRTTLTNSSGPSFGILLKGSSATYKTSAQDNTVRANLILNFNYAGIYMSQTNGNHLILNDISRMGADSNNCSGTIYGIYSKDAASSNRRNRIDSNHIHDLPKDSVSQGGNLNTLYGIYTSYISGNDSMRFSIFNNAIRNLHINKDCYVMSNSYNSYMDVLYNLVEDINLPVSGSSGINFYGIFNSYINGSYRINNNTITNCEGGYTWYGIQNYYPGQTSGVQQINGNVISNNRNAYYYRYNISSYFANYSDSTQRIEIAGNHIYENSTNNYYSYNIYCRYYGDYLIADNVIEKNVSAYYYHYGLFLQDYGTFNVKRNIIRGNTALTVGVGNVYGIYSQNNYGQTYTSNLIVENAGYSTTYGMYLHSAVSGNYKHEIRQNTISCNGTLSGNSFHGSYPVYCNLPYSRSLDFIGNIVEVLNSEMLSFYLLTYDNLNVDYNSYHVSNVNSELYSTTSDGSDTSLAGWIGLNLGSNELNAVTGHYFDSTSYASRWYYNQDNVPSVSYNLLDVYNVGRGSSFSDRGAVEYNGLTSVRQVNNQAEASFIYPNPNNGAMLFIYNAGIPQDAVFYDVNGKLLYTRSMDAGVNALEINFSPGIYFVYLSESGEVLKLVVE